MKDFFSKAISILISAAVLTVAFCGCSLLPTEEDVIAPPLVEPEVVEYKTTQVERGDSTKYLNVSGNFVSTLQYDVAFEERAGYISEINVSNGSVVEEGQVIAQLDVDDLEQQILMQKYTIEKLQINLDAAIDGKLENQMSDAQKRQVRLAEIDLEIAQITLQRFYTELNKSTIYAPVSGQVVYTTDKKVGEYIGTKSTICRIADPTALYVRYEGSDVNQFNLNADVEVTIQGTKYAGKVVVTPKTAPEEEASSRQYVLIEVLDGVPEDVEIGDLATLRLVLEQRTNVLLLSRSLIRSYGSGSYYVRVMTEDGTVQERPVELGLSTSTEAEILDGLEEGELVIIS